MYIDRYEYACMRVYMYVYISIISVEEFISPLYKHMHICMYIFTDRYEYVCIYVYMCICIYVSA